MAVEATKGDEAAKSVASLIGNLLTLQLASHKTRIQDTFPALMRNKLAAGYVFGFHDSCLRIFGLLDPHDPRAGLGLMKASYQSMVTRQGWLYLICLLAINMRQIFKWEDLAA